MLPRENVRACVGWLLAAAVIFVCASAPALAAAASGPAGAGALSPRLAALATPAVRSLPPAGQARVLSLARQGPGSLLREGNRVLVEVRFEHGAAAGVEDLRAAGAEIVNVSSRYQTDTVAATPAELRRIAAVANVGAVTEVLTPLVFTAGSACPSGLAVSEGDTQLRAAQARGEFDVSGSGVTVGILSDSFDQATQVADGSGPVATHAAEDIASGDLPGAGNPCGYASAVNVLENDLPKPEKEEPTDEGRAMAQIVHDLAPGANLAFASALNGPLSFAENIKKLAKPVPEGAGAQVITDDVAYFEEPFFQDGPIADAINEVTSTGVDYFAAAGNDNLIEEPEPGVERNIASWEAPEFRDSPPTPTSSCPEALRTRVGATNAADCMDFNPGPVIDNTFGITVEEGATLTVDLQWAEPWYGVETDLDAYLLNSAGEPIEKGGIPVGSTRNNVSISKEPVEVFQWENTGPTQGVQLAINRCISTCNPAASLSATPRLKFALLENGGGVSSTEYPTSSGGDTVGPTIFGHAGTAGANAIAAVPFYTSSEPEEYSSRGPVTHYFGPVNGTTPAAPLTSPETLAKPDVAATDGGASTFFASCVSSAWRFFGTSAAAPHAAAVAALVLQTNMSLTPAEVRTALAEGATPVGSFGQSAVGAGLIDAVGALEFLGAPQPFPNAVPGSPPSPPLCMESPSEPEPTPTPVTPPSTPTTTAAPPAAPTKQLQVVIAKHPPKVVRSRRSARRLTFLLGANEADVTFVCKVDRAVFHVCGTPFFHRYTIGPHVVRVMGHGSAGSADETPAVYGFQVKRVR